MARKARPAAPPEVVAAYEALIATIPELTIKGATLPYTSHNGNMFTTVTKEGVGLRLAKEDRESFMAEYGAGPLYSYGRQMREYVAVPAELLPKTEELAPVLAKSWQYVQTLKPKSTKKSGG